jgi:DNA-binding response OmpR family regulator
LLDSAPPKKGGLEILAEKKGDPDLNGIPVLMLTASENETSRRSGYELHANSRMVKPLHLDKIYKTISIGD